MRHELKILPEYFEEVYHHRKTFEVRKNDRPFKVGDELLLREWCFDGQYYTGRGCFRTITYILDNPDYVKDGMVILAIA